MKIIRTVPFEDGGRPPIRSYNGHTPPEDCVIVPEDMDTSVFAEHNGFVILEIEGDTVTGMEPNIEAWEAWKASLPPEPEPQIDLMEFLRGYVEGLTNG